MRRVWHGCRSSQPSRCVILFAPRGARSNAPSIWLACPGSNAATGSSAPAVGQLLLSDQERASGLRVAINLESLVRGFSLELSASWRRTRPSRSPTPAARCAKRSSSSSTPMGAPEGKSSSCAPILSEPTLTFLRASRSRTAAFADSAPRCTYSGEISGLILDEIVTSCLVVCKHE
jgi:hypothetical protein